MYTIEDMYELLPGNRQNTLKTEVSKACEISESHFYKLKNGSNKIDRLRRKEFFRLFKQHFTQYRETITQVLKDLKTLEHESNDNA